MSEQERTVSDLLAIFHDNNSKDISAGSSRDFIYSSYGKLHGKQLTAADSTYTMTADDFALYCDTAQGNINVILLEGVDSNSRFVLIVNVGSNAVVLTANGADTFFRGGESLTIKGMTSALLYKIGTVWSAINGSGNAGVFITDANPTAGGTVSGKTYADGIVLTSFDSDTRSLTISVTALTGTTHWKPVVSVNGFSVTNFTQQADGRWTGTVDIVLPGSDASYPIVALHEDGGAGVSLLSIAAGPVLTDLRLTGGYPVSQSELKQNDSFSITFTADSPCAQIEIEDFEAAQAGLLTVSGTGPTVVSVAIANRGAGTIANQRVKVRCKGANGIWGGYFMTDAFGVGDGSAYVQLNNDVPVISAIAQVNIDYPATQAALKNAEQAIVHHTVTFPTGTGSAAYTSPNGDLTVANPSTYETAKVVTRAGGSYNVGTTNLTIVATKTSNQAQVTRNAVVCIANVACTLSVATPYARLRSGGSMGTSAQNYSITLTANQQLYAAPTLAAPVGNWQGGGFAGGPSVWTRTLQIDDTMAKGTQSWGAVSGTNLAGIVTSAITGTSTYVLGGFVSRNLVMTPAWPNRETSIGTQVSDTSKLTCLNNSKGSGYSITFQTSTTNAVDKFTVTQPTTVYNPAGNLLYNCDQANAVNNTLGTDVFVLEEVV